MPTISKRRWQLTVFAAAIFILLLLGVSCQQAWVGKLDQAIIHLVRQPLPHAIQQLIITVTKSGNPHPVTWVTLILAAGLVIIQRYRGALFLTFNVLIWAGLGNSFIKHLVQRPRPTVERLVAASSFSFPSGHSITAMLLWGTLMVILPQILIRHPRALVVVQVLLGIWIFLIGVSRIYVGVHYPSDVLAGWSLGFVLLTVTQWFLTRYGDEL
ncbi:membrane-associated phospholipid phosphatase [Levilactobacillus senmaizukei DSM 21775 = NBRC 103853]|uniref:Membrane-associated phospholipid phosphatase n=1 Tax=Levilactobacillus senmaizukei DSM 21775 = NBRC 103853 TaxID=1423803 RepID=A0A0R2DC55_9LACO|nr:phosphatase PAP2 family protein [Levilactobacillus senmaizukei]KRN01616.1 membrane-associated phospholipid phosphatase [Levilactobacillus senmaizukei DSM 21775 = NBRC 103853]